MKHLTVILFFGLICSGYSQTPELVLPIAHAKPIQRSIFTPDDRLLITGGADSVTKIWDVASGRLYKSIPAFVADIAVSADGKMLAIVGGWRVDFVDLTTFTMIKTVEREDRNLTFSSGCFSPDGKTFYLTGWINNHALVWAMKTNDFQKVQIYDHEDSQDAIHTVEGIAASPDGKKLMVWIRKSGSVLINLATRQVEKTIAPATELLDFAPDGSILARKTEINGATKSIVYQLMSADAVNVKQQFKINGATSTLGLQQNFTRTGDKFLVSDSFDAWLCDVKNSSVRTIPRKSEWGFQNISNDGKRLLFATASPVLFDLTANSEAPVRVFGQQIFETKELATSLVKNELMLGNDTRLVKYLDLLADGFRLRTFDQQKNVAEAIALSPDGKTAAVANGSYAYVNLLDLTKPTFNPTKLEFKNNRSPQSAIFSPDGRYLANVHDKFFSMTDVVNKKIMYERENEGIFLMPRHTNLGIFSPDSKQFVYLSWPQDSRTKQTRAEPRVNCVDVQTGNLIWTQKYNVAGFTYTEDGKAIVAFNVDTVMNRRNQVVTLNAATGEKLKEWNLTEAQSSKELRLSTGATTLINSTKKHGVDIYDVQKQTLLASLPGLSVWINNLGFLKNKRYAISTGQDNFIRFYDLEKKQQIASLVLYQATNDWAVFTSDGRFEASPDALKTMYYVKGREFIPLESLYEKFYTPRLLQSLLEGADLGPAPIRIEEIKFPPVVRMSAPIDINARNLTVENDTPSVRRFSSATGKIKLSVEASANEDEVSEIRLYHNGKLIGTGTRNLTVEDDRVAKNKTQIFEIQLSEGENNFRAIALNTQRTESKPDDIIVVNKASSTVESSNPTTTATLHILVVGINQYKNPKYNLNYATADATGFKEAIERSSTGLYAKVNAVYIGDAQATKMGITAELEKIKVAAQARDVFIFYYAGHGVMSESKQFFMVPHDVTQLYGADEALVQKGISSALMQQFSREIKAQKQLFILDACQSAGALDQVAMRGAAEEKAISQLARATGTHWLTASGSEQFAAEFKQLGHGTFTYVLLEALAGKADKGNDRKITVKELDAYLQEIVPEVTAKYRGAAQYPASYGIGNDFPIGVVK